MLGHIIIGQGICIDQDKIKAILNGPEPKTVTELRSFLSIAGYYTRFIRSFSGIAGVLHAATSKNRKFSFTDDMRLAFPDLKENLTTPFVLALPKFEAPVKVETDPSPVAVSAVLSQKEEDGKFNPVRFTSRAMCAVEKKYLVCKKVAFGVMIALQKFRIDLR